MQTFSENWRPPFFAYANWLSEVGIAVHPGQRNANDGGEEILRFQGIPASQ